VSQSLEPQSPETLSTRQKLLCLVTAFLGWMFAGSVMVLIPLAGRAATIGMGEADEARVGQWFSWYICAFLLGAAAGGWWFGAMGDRIGRAKAMGLSILWYSLFTGATVWVANPMQLLMLRFVACLGVGGMWPNGVALVSEVWSDVSRPLLAGLIGTAANFGFVLFGLIASYVAIDPAHWRWIFAAAAMPLPLGLFVLLAVPESPRWKAGKCRASPTSRSPTAEVFRPPLLRRTIIGIFLGMIPLLGNWGGANWLVPWAGAVGGAADPFLKSHIQTIRSTGAALGSLIGGWLASFLGRRTTYFLISLMSLGSSIYLFWYLEPGMPGFLLWTFVLGFFGTVFFGWLPLYLPELFPTRVRATGSGVTFNFGRIATAAGVLGAGQLMLRFHGDYARVGQLTSLIYVAGLVIVFFAPDTSKHRLDD